MTSEEIMKYVKEELKSVTGKPVFDPETEEEAIQRISQCLYNLSVTHDTKVEISDAKMSGSLFTATLRIKYIGDE